MQHTLIVARLGEELYRNLVQQDRIIFELDKLGLKMNEISLGKFVKSGYTTRGRGEYKLWLFDAGEL